MADYALDFYSGFEGMDEFVFRTNISGDSFAVHVWEGYLDWIFSMLFTLNPWHAGTYTNMWNEGRFGVALDPTWGIEDLTGFLQEWSVYPAFATEDERGLLDMHAAVTKLLVAASDAFAPVCVERC